MNSTPVLFSSSLIEMSFTACLMVLGMAAISTAQFDSHLLPVQAAWSSFKSTFSKNYSSLDEEQLRFKNYVKNLELIESHNQLYRNGNSSYTLGVNSYADLSEGEIKHLLLHGGRNQGHSKTDPRATTIFQPLQGQRLPPEMDWRKKGYVTPVEFQRLCGSCWAFSAIGALEGQHFNKTGRLRVLSEQQLVDCSGSYGNHGCFGGDMSLAFSYIMDAGGVESDQDYPYRGFEWKCRFNKSAVVAKVTGYVTVPSSEDALQAAVASVGPIAVSMTTPLKFIFYKAGVFDDPQCVEHNLGDHAILAIGYGTYQDSDYWLIKNSFGTFWGMEGYGMMSRNKNNQCNIANEPTYPIV